MKRTKEDVTRDFTQCCQVLGNTEYKIKQLEAQRNTLFNQIATLDNEMGKLNEIDKLIEEEKVNEAKRKADKTKSNKADSNKADKK